MLLFVGGLVVPQLIYALQLEVAVVRLMTVPEGCALDPEEAPGGVKTTMAAVGVLPPV